MSAIARDGLALVRALQSAPVETWQVIGSTTAGAVIVRDVDDGPAEALGPSSSGVVVFAVHTTPAEVVRLIEVMREAAAGRGLVAPGPRPRRLIEL